MVQAGLDLLASTSSWLGLQVCVLCPIYVLLGLELKVSCLLDKDSMNCVISYPGPFFLQRSLYPLIPFKPTPYSSGFDIISRWGF